MDGTVLITPCSALSERLQAALNIYTTWVCTQNKHGAISEKMPPPPPPPPAPICPCPPHTTTPLAVTLDGFSDYIPRLELDSGPSCLRSSSHSTSLLLPPSQRLFSLHSGFGFQQRRRRLPEEDRCDISLLLWGQIPLKSALEGVHRSSQWFLLRRHCIFMSGVFQ